MPGAGHLVHMPAHIYIRVGRWADAIAANEHAVHADQAYIADQRPEGIYPLAYYPHNHHFLSFAAAMAGRSEQAIRAARAVTENVRVEIAREVPPLEPLLPYHHLTLVTFGRWDDVLRTPPPPPDLRFATGLTAYARGVAFAARQQWSDAAAALDTVRHVGASAVGDNRPILEIAEHALAGEIAFRRGQLADAERHFGAAMRIEDEMIYFEPPPWYYPIRHSLGAVLLHAGRPAEAERLYREDLRRFPENGWSLHGLAESLRRQGMTEEAASVEQRLARAWDRADVTLAASRF
jgi:tetratricopeptide (TPR) repeat protein